MVAQVVAEAFHRCEVRCLKLDIRDGMEPDEVDLARQTFEQLK